LSLASRGGNVSVIQKHYTIDLFVIHDTFFPHPRSLSRGEREAKALSLRDKGGDEGSEFELKFCHVFWKGQ
jgi:hypothetical protein